MIYIISKHWVGNSWWCNSSTWVATTTLSCRGQGTMEFKASIVGIDVGGRPCRRSWIGINLLGLHSIEGHLYISMSRCICVRMYPTMRKAMCMHPRMRDHVHAHARARWQPNRQRDRHTDNHTHTHTRTHIFTILLPCRYSAIGILRTRRRRSLLPQGSRSPPP